MKTEMKIKPYHLRFSFVLLLMILLHFCICGAASAKKSNSMISGDQCNATIAECLADEREGEEEFLMESETTRRFLANNPTIVYKTLQRPAVCTKCMDLYNLNKKRGCAIYHDCRQGSG
ncbi:hypothetical protein HYC85_002662 [Camellia sinensis]|uniref:Gnk2-homologous domain-containing protein n=1 Tax=Camellia sinensis TaxID=4442 RepID=A0A7J7I8W7_CAMSI|nr:hypothetical protein HYC85_002662 [Camellia sinensis]